MSTCVILWSKYENCLGGEKSWDLFNSWPLNLTQLCGKGVEDKTFKDMSLSIPKSDLLGVTVALIHVAAQQFLAWNAEFCANSRGNRPYSCEIRVISQLWQKWLLPLRTSLNRIILNSIANHRKWYILSQIWKEYHRASLKLFSLFSTYYISLSPIT